MNYCQRSHCKACWFCPCIVPKGCPVSLMWLIHKSRYKPLCVACTVPKSNIHKTKTTASDKIFFKTYIGGSKTQKATWHHPLFLLFAGKSIDDRTKIGWCHVYTFVGLYMTPNFFRSVANPLGAHAQRWLPLFVTECVCPSVCLLPRFLRLRAMREQISATNGFIATLKKGVFRITTAFKGQNAN